MIGFVVFISWQRGVKARSMKVHVRKGEEEWVSTNFEIAIRCGCCCGPHLNAGGNHSVWLKLFRKWQYLRLRCSRWQGRSSQEQEVRREYGRSVRTMRTSNFARVESLIDLQETNVLVNFRIEWASFQRMDYC